MSVLGRCPSYRESNKGSKFLADSRLFRPSLPGPTLCLRELNYVWPLELICFIFTWNSIGLLFKPCACYCKNKVSDLNPGLICQISYVNQSFLDYGRVAGAYIEDITWPRGDTKFLFECWKIFHEWAQRMSEIFSTREEKFRISKRPCNVPFIT